MKFKRFFGIVHSTTTVVLFVRLLNSKYVNYLMPFYNRNINIMKQINCFYYEFGWHKTSKCDRWFVFFYRKILSLSANNLEYEQRKKHSKTTVTDTHKNRSIRRSLPPTLARIQWTPSNSGTKNHKQWNWIKFVVASVHTKFLFQFSHESCDPFERWTFQSFSTSINDSTTKRMEIIKKD